MHKQLQLLLAAMLLLTAGCVKETYDMNKLSKKATLSPSLGMAVVKGDVSLADIVKPNDTIVYGSDNLVSVVFTDDSVINMDVNDFYDFGSLVSFNRKYLLGDLVIDPFQASTTYTLSEISAGFTPALQSQFSTLDDGAVHPFPSFPAVPLAEKNLAPFAEFQTAVFRSGYLDVAVQNNLTAPLGSLIIRLYNTSGHTQVGSDVNLPSIPAGQTQTVSVDLSDLSISNALTVGILLSGSPGTTTPVLISMVGSNIKLFVTGRDLKVQSGRVILPQQYITSFNSKDTVSFDPGDGIQLEEVKTVAGDIGYTVKSSAPVKITLNTHLPTILRNGLALSQSLSANPHTTITGTISAANTFFGLGSDAGQPYNRVPMENSLIVTSEGAQVDFNSTDEVTFTIKLLNPEFDYLKGYLGQHTGNIEPDSADMGISDVLDRLSGTFMLASPVVTFSYLNSFSAPIRLELDATGRRGSQKVDMEFQPVMLDFPDAPDQKSISSSFIINNSNSSVPALLSLPPETISYSGTAKMNPAGNTGTRNDYVWGDSRFVASMKVEVPLDLKINNLQFTDTLDNFMKVDDPDPDFNYSDISEARIEVTASNGFPLGASLEVSLYDTLSHTIKSSVEAKDILAPAPVDATGKSNGVTESKTSVELTSDFFANINTSDRIIFRFTLVSTGEGAKNVKIYSDYRISFKAAVVVKPQLDF